MKGQVQRMRLGAGVALLVLLLSLGGAAAQAATAAANGGPVVGRVTSPGGYPLPLGTVVRLFDPDGANLRGTAQPDPATGSFNFPLLPNGLYVLKAVAPVESGYTQSLPKVISIINLPLNAGDLALTTPQITGVVSGPGGAAVPAEVLVHLGDGRVLQAVPAPAGNYAIGGLPAGSYALQAFPTGNDPLWKSVPAPVVVANGQPAQTVNLQLRPAQLWGTVREAGGRPVAGAKVLAAAGSGEPAGDLSNAQGFWAIGGLAAGSYRLGALPPWPTSGLLPPEPVTVTLPGAPNPFALVFGTPPKRVQGVVRTNSGAPVLHAQVLAHRVNAPGHAAVVSAADGSYQMQLGAGLWALSVQPISDTLPADWVFANPPQLVFFQHDNQPENRVQDFTVLSADSAVIGSIQMPDGSPPPFTVTVALRTDEGVGRHVDTLPGDGSFRVSVPSGGYKLVVHPHHPGYVGPLVPPVVAPANSQADLGILKLLARDAVITGTLNVGGAPLAGIPVTAWREGTPGSLHTASGPDGRYALAVAEGAWHVQPAPGPLQPYLYTGPGQSATLAAGESLGNVDFTLLAANATIVGTLVNEQGAPVNDASGWAVARQAGTPAVHNGAPVENGRFALRVPAGTYLVRVDLPAGGRYTSAVERQVTVPAGGQVEVSLVVQVKNARISGALWNSRSEQVVSGVRGIAAAWAGENWAAAPVDPGNGTYRLDVSAGLWRLNYRIEPQAGYVKSGGPVNVAVQAGQTVIAPLPVLAADGRLRGLALDPDGNPLEGAVVLAQGLEPRLQEVRVEGRSAADGSFGLALPAGRYRLGAAFPQAGWIRPVERVVDVPPGGVLDGQDLQFLRPDAEISGNLLVAGAPHGGQVQVWAWSSQGGFSGGRFDVAAGPDGAAGSYRLPASAGAEWRLRAIFETETAYWLGQAQADLSGGSASQDIRLEGPFPKPAPVVVTFDPAQPQHIELADGTHIFIPAGAMPVDGPVTLRVVPLAGLPSERSANVFRFGYAFLASGVDGEPVEAHFNQDVVISFQYDEQDLQRQHLSEQWLRPAYYSTTGQRWTYPESFVIDMQANRVLLQIDHFTDYALVSEEIFSQYLPVTVRTH